MKIIEMQRKTIDGKSVEYDPIYECGNEYRDWWCVIETLEEEWIYKQFVHEIASNIQSQSLINLWNSLVKHAGQDMGLAWGDDDVYGYISPRETVPEVGDIFVDGEGDKWVRTQ